MENLPPGKYDVHPAEGQRIIPMTLVYQEWEFDLREREDAPSATPYPTYTPLPTYTALPTYTPFPSLGAPTSTPTQESGVGTPDPRPERFCEARVHGAFHRVRADRSLDAPEVGAMAPSTWMIVTKIVRDREGNEWVFGTGENANGVKLSGWAMITDNLELQDSSECWAVEFIDEQNPIPTAAPTATPEVIPTVDITPRPQTCVYRSPSNMNIRASWLANAPVVGLLPANTPAVVGHIYPNTTTESRAYITYNNITGWVAIRVGVTTYGALEGNCASIPRTEPRLQLNTAVGIRTVPGAGDFTVMYPILEEKGIPFGVSPYHSLGYCVDALQKGGICIFRPGAPDCPSGPGVVDPQQSARDFMQHAAGAATVLKGAKGAYIEPINECMGTPISGELLAWWAVWMSTYIDEAAARGWPPLALPGLPPGHGDEHMFRAWKPVLTKLAAHGGLFSMHAYTFNSRTGLCAYDEWEAARHVRNYRLMQEQGYSIPITITEAARGAGEMPVDVNDMVCFIEKVRAEGFIHSIWLWVGGHHPVWPLANLDGYYAEIAERIGS